MRILIVGDRDNSAVKTITKLLSRGGHEVGIHSREQLPDNALGRLRGSLGLDRNPARLRALIAKWKPDCVHVVGCSGYPAPALCLSARQAGVRTVWSATDFAPLCPAGNCRTPQGRVCEECMHGERHFMVHRCIDKNPFNSFIGLVDTLYWDVTRLEKVADTVAVTSDFMRSKWLEAGFPSQRIETLPLPYDQEEGEKLPRENYFYYEGDLSSESGVETLVKAAIAGDVTLIIAGRGEMQERIQTLISHTSNIKLLSEGSTELMAKAKASVVPAESYLCGETQVKKALSLGTPVIVSAIAGLPEMVEASDGVTFTPGNSEELAAVLREFDKRHAFCHSEISQRNRDKYSEETYYKNLLKIYRGCR